MNLNKLNMDFIKYPIIGLIIYILLKNFTEIKTNLFFITLLIVLFVIVIETFYDYITKDNSIEGLDAVPSIDTSPTIITTVAETNPKPIATLITTNTPTTSVPPVIETTTIVPTQNAVSNPISGASLTQKTDPILDTSQDLYKKNSDGSYTISVPQNTTSRKDNGVVSNEGKYTYYDYTTLPENKNQDTSYSIIPQSMWYPQPPRPPVCITDKVCPVCPIYTDGTNVDLKEWDESRRITPPDNINLNYVKDKLNSGR